MVSTLNKSKTKENNEAVELQTSFENDIDPIQLLEELDVYIAQLHSHPSKELVTSIEKRLSQLEFIAIKTNDETQWVVAPFQIKKETIRRSMYERITHLLKTRGEWRSEYKYRNSIQVEYRRVAPLTITISGETRNGMLDDSINSMLVPLAHIHSTITSILENGASTIGIFEKPYGVIAMNQARGWIQRNETHGSWSLKHQLEVKNIAEVIKSATYSVVGSKE